MHGDSAELPTRDLGAGAPLAGREVTPTTVISILDSLDGAGLDAWVGYEPKAKDVHDVLALHRAFGIELPGAYRRFLGWR